MITRVVIAQGVLTELFLLFEEKYIKQLNFLLFPNR
jgi:hypothetical protein